MEETNRLKLEVAELRDRLSKLNEASFRLTASLDMAIVLKEVIDNARLLTGARYGALVSFDDSGGIQELITSGITEEERRLLTDSPKGLGLLGYLNEIQEPLRLGNIAEHPRSVGFPKNHPPMKTFLGTPVHQAGKIFGNIYLTEKEGGLEFLLEDEETLAMFASQAEMAIANALRYREEQQARANLEGLVQTSPVGVVVIEADTKAVVSSNLEAERILGIPPSIDTLEELRHGVSLRYMDGSPYPLQTAPIERVFNLGETVRGEEIVVHRADGQATTVMVNATPIYSVQGEIVSAVSILQDITPLEELERSRSEFLGMVSHELRTPLTAIKGATTLGTASQLEPAENRQIFRIIDGQVDLMRDLVNNLLDVTQIESGKLAVRAEPTDMADLIDQAKGVFLRSWGSDRIEVQLVRPLPRIWADRHRVVQVLNNLLSNAAKYSAESSSIRVVASQQDLHVAVSVADEGIGIPAEHLPNLFGKFSRVGHTDGGRKVEGHGLGLAVCKGIVEAHGGRIWAESDGPGRGSRFTFTIPIIDEGMSDAATYSPQQSAASGGVRDNGTRARVLVVDDDPQILWYVQHVLSEAGLSPVLTGNPKDVRRLVEEERPDLILLDLVLPGTSGFELMELISGISDAPVIFVSGQEGENDIARALEMGAYDYVVKPFTPTELVARINACLRKRVLSAQTSDSYRLGDLTIDYAERTVTLAGRPVQLTATEYRLLHELSINAGRVLTYDQLLRRVWGPEYSGDTQLVHSFIRSLRRKLLDNARRPTYLFTEYRVGYRLAKPVSGVGIT